MDVVKGARNGHAGTLRLPYPFDYTSYIPALQSQEVALTACHDDWAAQGRRAALARQ